MSSALNKIIRRLSNLSPRASDIQPAMEKHRDRIRSRSLAGVDVNGFPFRPKKDGSASHLSRTGNLLSSLRAMAEEDAGGVRGRVTVTGRARAYAPFVNAKRKFLGASPGDRASIVDDMRASMRARRNDG